MESNFTMLGISEQFVSILSQTGIKEPTPVQQQVIPLLLQGKDVIAKAQTGTGKTLAFVLPIMQRIDARQPFVQALVITPTRELALQITAEIKKLVLGREVNILAAYGGQDVEQQIKKLKGAVHIVIGTPGRLLDHIRRKTIDLSKLSVLVLDEADQMLEMGFQAEVEHIIKSTSRRRQTMLFSATLPKGIRMLTSKYMREPAEIRIQSKSITLKEIVQEVIVTTDRGKQDALCKVIDEYKPFMAMIFCRTKRRAGELNQVLQLRGYDSEELHGDLTQGKREKVMKAFRAVKIQFLVATDIAARGLDIEGVTHIFNYDIPADVDSYIHRIGRTGRAGQAGMAVTFITSKDIEQLNLIEQGIQETLKKRKIVSSNDKDTDQGVEVRTKSPKRALGTGSARGNAKPKPYERRSATPSATRSRRDSRDGKGKSRAGGYKKGSGR